MLSKIRKRLRALPADESGVVMLETVLVFPVQLMVMMVIIQIAHIYVAANVLQYAAYQGVRTATVNLRGKNDDEAYARGVQAAWVIASTINNTGGGDQTVRVPKNNYLYSSYAVDGVERMQLTLKAAKSSSGSSENLIVGEVTYWMDLVVPVGGPFVYHALKAAGKPVRVADPSTKRGQALLRQGARIPKPWPH